MAASISMNVTRTEWSVPRIRSLVRENAVGESNTFTSYRCWVLDLIFVALQYHQRLMAANYIKLALIVRTFPRRQILLNLPLPKNFRITVHQRRRRIVRNCTFIKN